MCTYHAEPLHVRTYNVACLLKGRQVKQSLQRIQAILKCEMWLKIFYIYIMYIKHLFYLNKSLNDTISKLLKLNFKLKTFEIVET